MQVEQEEVDHVPPGRGGAHARVELELTDVRLDREGEVERVRDPLGDARRLVVDALWQVVGELQVALRHPLRVVGRVGAQLVGRGDADRARHAIAVARPQVFLAADALDVAGEVLGQIGDRVDVRPEGRPHREERVLVVDDFDVEGGDDAVAVKAALDLGGGGIAGVHFLRLAAGRTPARARVLVVARPPHQPEGLAPHLEEDA